MTLLPETLWADGSGPVRVVDFDKINLSYKGSQGSFPLFSILQGNVVPTVMQSGSS